MATGRFAPSPTGPLHLGNLRTALVAWLAARSVGSELRMRVEDLDPRTARAEVEQRQLADLRLLGLDWDGPIMRQSTRRQAHDAAIAELAARDLLYECFCSRREVAEAAAAPHAEQVQGAYPGTCRTLTDDERRRRREQGRPAALRLRADGARVEATDVLAGTVERVVDDFVIRRNDNTPSYNLAVVVDDAAQGVQQVVRGDDLLDSTPRQVLLCSLLDLPTPSYAHVPLVLGPDGQRLAKRHGAITLADCHDLGITADAVRSMLAASLDLTEVGEKVTANQLTERFVLEDLDRTPWVLPDLAHAPFER